MPSVAQFPRPEEFAPSFDTRPFLLHHNLSQYELLAFPALHRLAKKASEMGSMSSRNGMRKPTAPGYLVVKGHALRWNSPEFHRALDEAFEDFEHSNVRLKLTAIHQYDGYRELMAECTRSLSEVTGVNFARQYGPGIATLFISSPHETTPYHIDEEINFLLEIHGQKLVHIFDGQDRNIVSSKDLEQFWFGKCFLEQPPGSSCQTFEIGPQQGVFNPPFFPHIVETRERPCVSLSLGFQRRRFPEAEVHRMNAYMRKFGWTPKPLGVSPGVDRVKSLMIRRALTVKRAVAGS